MPASFETQHLVQSFDDSVTVRAPTETAPIVAIHWVDRNRFYETVMER